MIVPESVDLELDCSQCEGKYHDIKNNQLLNHKDHQGSCKNMLLCSIKKSISSPGRFKKGFLMKRNCKIGSKYLKYVFKSSFSVIGKR